MQLLTKNVGNRPQPFQKGYISIRGRVSGESGLGSRGPKRQKKTAFVVG